MLSLQNRSDGLVEVVKAGANAQPTDRSDGLVEVVKAGANAQHTEQKRWTGSGTHSEHRFPAPSSKLCQI